MDCAHMHGQSETALWCASGCVCCVNLDGHTTGMRCWVSCIEVRAVGEETVVLQVNQKVSKTAHIKELNQEIDRLKAELFCTREKNGVYMPAELFQQREQVSLAAELAPPSKALVARPCAKCEPR